MSGEDHKAQVLDKEVLKQYFSMWLLSYRGMIYLYVLQFVLGLEAINTTHCTHCSAHTAVRSL